MSPDDPRHGEERGYFAHHAAGQEACDACTRAHSVAQKRRDMDRLRGRPRMIPATGTRRRLQALAALGWTQGDIAEAAGWSSRECVKAVLYQQQTVGRRVAARVEKAYGELSMRLPEMTSQRSRVRNDAHRKGWMPPLAWQDIDDPDEQPATPYAPRRVKRDAHDIDPVLVQRILDGDTSLAPVATRAERREAYKTWTARGHSPAELERATGWPAHRYWKAGDAA